MSEMAPITEQDRLDAIEGIADTLEHFSLEASAIRALDSHRLTPTSYLNLGYYRTFVECSCGAGWWFGEHDGDPTATDRWLAHRARVLAGEIS